MISSVHATVTVRVTACRLSTPTLSVLAAAVVVLGPITSEIKSSNATKWKVLLTVMKRYRFLCVRRLSEVFVELERSGARP